jgi:hypothetical protein
MYNSSVQEVLGGVFGNLEEEMYKRQEEALFNRYKEYFFQFVRGNVL